MTKQPSPKKITIAKTLLLMAAFCLPLCGSFELFIFLACMQIMVIISGFWATANTGFSVISFLHAQHRMALLFFIAWLIAINLSYIKVLVSNDNLMHLFAATLRQLFILLQICFFGAALRILVISQLPYKQVLLCFCSGVLVLIFIHALALLFGPTPHPQVWLYAPPLSPNIRDIGNLSVAACLMISSLYCFESTVKKRALLLVLATVLWAFIFWTGGRAAIASTTLASLFLIGVCWLFSKESKKHSLLLIVAMLGGFFICNQAQVFDWNGLGHFSQQSETSASTGDLSTGRMEMWQWSFKAFSQQPLLGLGPYGFGFIPERSASNFLPDQPHNIVLQTLVEWGIMGTICFFGFLISLAISSLKHLPKHLRESSNAVSSSFIAATMAILALSLHSLTGGAYWNYQPVFTLVLCYLSFPFLLTASNYRSND